MVIIVIDVPEVPQTLHPQRERGRLQVAGHRTDDHSSHTLLVIHEADGLWAIHGLGTPGVRLPATTMLALAESILKRAR
jgi:hypothetical protein